MAILGWRRILEGTGFSGKVGEPLRYDEAWLIRNSSMLDTKQSIVKAVPCGWYAAHWENAACKAMEFKLSPVVKEGLCWRLDVAFYPPPPNRQINETTGVPKDFWERSGGTSTVPLFIDNAGAMIVNAAGDPIEGLQREREEKSWTLTKYYTSDAWMADAGAYAGSMNSDSWDGGAPLTWKCGLRSAKVREIQNVSRGQTASNATEGAPVAGGTDDNIKVVETVWDFRYEPSTWNCLPWNVGFHELVGGQRKVILGFDGKPVRQPVALTFLGTKKPDGESPSIIRDGAGAEIYPKTAFSAKFGQPFIIPAAGA